MTARAQEDNPIGSLLLDVLLVLEEADMKRMFSRDLVQGLMGFGDLPWGELSRGKTVTEGWLARQLRPYGIKPRTIRIGEKVAKGYVKEDHMEAFRRYIPKSALEKHCRRKWRNETAPRSARIKGRRMEQERDEARKILLNGSASLFSDIWPRTGRDWPYPRGRWRAGVHPKGPYSY